MAGDWVKMRVSLPRDPRVIYMADWLAIQPEFIRWFVGSIGDSSVEYSFSHVTRHVTISLCVTALLVTWGTAREQGDRDGDDLVLFKCNLDTISSMTFLPGFGKAMEFIGWAKQNFDDSVTFPKFFRDHESPIERHQR